MSGDTGLPAGTDAAPAATGLHRPRDRALVLAVAGIVLASRLPFLGPGYGSDPDAWRVANTARAIAANHRYQASRLPGFPVQELVSASLWRGGPLALNGVGALLTALGAGWFARSLRRLGTRDAGLAALALASTPAVYVASTSALDYGWALGFGLGALDLALAGRAGWAGVLVGLAAGCRLTSLALLVPLGLLLRREGAPRGSSLVRFGLAALAGSATVMLPPFLTYGAGFLSVYERGYPRLLFVAKSATVDVWGIPGTAALVGAAGAWAPGLRAPRRVASIPARPNLRVIWAAASGIVIYAAAFLRLPHEGDYLIMAAPFVLLLGAATLERRWFVVLCAALLLSPWCLKVVQPGKPDAPPLLKWAVPVPPGGAFVLDVLHGPLVTDHLRRVEAIRYAERVIARVDRLGGRSVVAAYEWLPLLRERLQGDVRGGVRFVYLPDEPMMRALCAAGVDVYLLPGAEEESRKVNGVSLTALGARPLLP